MFMAAVTGWSCSAPVDEEPADQLPRVVTPTCDQACQDDLVGYAIDNTLWLLWNESLAGHPSGPQDLTAPCPLGGSAHVAGTTGVSTQGINTANLTLTLAGCRSSGSSFSLAFTGTVSWVGSFSRDHANAITFASRSLAIDGDLIRYQDLHISESCAVSLTDTYDKNSSTKSVWLTGEICGRRTSQ